MKKMQMGKTVLDFFWGGGVMSKLIGRKAEDADAEIYFFLQPAAKPPTLQLGGEGASTCMCSCNTQKHVHTRMPALYWLA